MRVLLVDSYDSYTYNLFQLIALVDGEEPTTVRNDDRRLCPDFARDFDAVVLSPGPGGPHRSGDLGGIPALLGARDVPVLGVCLGAQVIGHLAGAQVRQAPAARHGHLSTISHRGGALFAGIPQRFAGVRYHSLCVAEPLPDTLDVLAHAEDGVLMALQHRRRPWWGVQFHPESVASDHGEQLIGNFLRLAQARSATPGRAAPRQGRTAAPRQGRTAAPRQGRTAAPTLRISHGSVTTRTTTETMFRSLFAASRHAFWLDSGRQGERTGRFSFLGDGTGPLSELLTYRVGDGFVEKHAAGQPTLRLPGDVYTVLGDRIAAGRIADPGLPFDLTGGYVGFFGYETKADCGGSAAHRAPTTDSMWLLADRLLAVDQLTGEVHALALYDGRTVTAESARDWVRATLADLADLADPAEADGPTTEPTTEPTTKQRAAGEPHLVRGRAQYLDDVRSCLSALAVGDSYEICLTDTVRVPAHDAEADLHRYLRLRSTNPAQYAAFLRLGGLTVLSSSPERFLRISGDGAVDSGPIKGTAPRGDDDVCDAALAARLASDPKTRAENLMIVDLLRNDLGRVCQVGSIEVPRFLAVESYATVHQLVSTISGRLRPDVPAVECARAAFPPGSMTGAPKVRTMQILDRLEGRARGVYSGALGYFGLAGGADLSVVIRTAVRHGDELRIGTGGAIVIGSDPLAELDEMLLKAAAVVRAMTPTRVDHGNEVDIPVADRHFHP